MSRTEETDPAALVVVARQRRLPKDADAAFEKLYELSRVEVFSFLVRLVGDRALAEDVLQETYFRVYRSLDRYEIDRPFRSWVFQIARHAAIDAIRGRNKEARLEGERARSAGPEAQADPPDLERREELERARGALDALPEDARALLIDAARGRAQKT